MYDLILFTEELQEKAIDFYYKCLPQSGRKFEPKGRHHGLTIIKDAFDIFWCLVYDNKIIGTVGVNKLSADKCELKSLYLLNEYYGKGLGKKMLDKALEYAKKNWFKEVYLETLSISERAIKLYAKNGFVEIERYNDNVIAEVFMKATIKWMVNINI